MPPVVFDGEGWVREGDTWETPVMPLVVFDGEGWVGEVSGGHPQPGHAAAPRTEL